MSEVIDFPYFDVVNARFPGPVTEFNALALRATLEACGFEVLRMPTRTKNLPLMFDNLPSHERIATQFGVILPGGWQRVLYERRSNEGDAETEFLLDTRGRYRGWIALDQEGIPIIGELACRYHILWNPSVYKIPVPEPEEAVRREWLVVVDQAAVRYREPTIYPLVVHHDFRWPIAINWPLDLRIHDAKRRGIRNAQRQREGKPPDEHPVQRWLNENYPRWQDPSAYW